MLTALGMLTAYLGKQVRNCHDAGDSPAKGTIRTRGKPNRSIENPLPAA